MTAALPDWMMLERFVFRRDDDASFPDDEAAPFRAYAISPLGDPFTVAFRIANPPAVSRLYLSWPRGLEEPKEGTSCELVGAHRNLLLFTLFAHHEVIEKRPYVVRRQDYFICGSHPSSQPSLLLRKIPRCDQPAFLGVREGKKIINQHNFDTDPVSILCRGEEDFAVAQLVLGRPHALAKMEAELCVLRSKVNTLRHRWELEKKLPILYEAHELSDLVSWTTHRVIPFNDYLCWVDYRVGGILFCKVFQRRPHISYLRLSVRNCSSYLRPLFEANRSVCITRGTMGCDELKFVDIARKDAGRYHLPRFEDTLRPDDFSISYHALKTTESGAVEWDMVFFVTCYELWDLNPTLPREALTYPLVSMDKPSVVHFLLSERQERSFDKVSVVTIDMSTNMVKSIQPYIGKGDLWAQDIDMIQHNSGYLQTFLPSELPKFLNLNRSTGVLKKTP